MAALVAQPSFDLGKFAANCVRNLPSYSVPKFVRFLPKMRTTGTFKLKKNRLRGEGCDPSKIKDPLFVFDAQTATYAPWTSEDYAKLLSTRSRL